MFEELDEGHRVEFHKDRSDAEAAEVLSNMEPDNAADLLMQLAQERRLPILELLEPNQQRKVRALLGYHPESAGGLMNNEFVAMPAGQLAGDALARLREMAEWRWRGRPAAARFDAAASAASSSPHRR